MIRYSTEKDIDGIKKVIEKCFGDRVSSECYENLTGRYLLYIIDNEVVALTGLLYSKKYKAFEMDWTGTLPEHRHKGYMQELFKRLLQSTDEDIYCSCWRLPHRDINLHTLMELFDFECVMSPRVAWAVEYNCSKDIITCVNCTGDNCRCYEDLYIRRAKKD